MREILSKMDRIGKLRVMVLGDYMVDRYLQGEVSRISPEAPVPVVRVEAKTLRLGGAGNVVRNVCALGAKVYAAGCVGSDDGGDWIKSRLTEYDADTTLLMQNSARITSVKTRVTGQNQQLLRYDEEKLEPVPEVFCRELKALGETLFPKLDAVIVSDYGKGTVTEGVMQIVLGLACKHGLKVFVDPKGRDYSKYRGVAACTPNLKELSEASGCMVDTEEKLHQAALQLCRAHQFEYLLVTRSADGMSLISAVSGEKTDYPAVAKEVVDVTGAGDTVISAFTLAFAAGFSVDACCDFSNAAASVVVSRFGAAAVSLGEIVESFSAGQREKQVSMGELDGIAAALKKQGKRIVFTNGCFDLVHAGHIASFRKARMLGDVLIVGINSDASIRRIKGEKRPIVCLEDRLQLLSAIEPIDYLIPFEEDTPELLIQRLSPDVLVKGRDWEGKTVAGGDYVQSYGGKVAFIDLEEGLSTTRLIEKILGTYGKEERA